MEVVTWIPTPSPLEFIPEGFQAREIHPKCFHCGESVNERKTGPYKTPAFCTTKTECKNALRVWKRNQAKAQREREKARERQMEEPTIRIVHPPVSVPTSPGLIAQIEKMFGPCKAPSEPKMSAAERLFKEWQSPGGIAAQKPHRNPPATHTRTAAAKVHDAVVDRLIAERSEAVEAERRRIANSIVEDKLPPPSETQPIAKEASSEVTLTGEIMASLPESTCPIEGKSLPDGNTTGFCASHWYSHTGKFRVQDYISALRKNVEIPEKLRPHLSAKQRGVLMAEGLEVPPDPANGNNKDKQRATPQVKPKGRSKPKRKAASRSKGITAISGPAKADRKAAADIISSLKVGGFADLAKALITTAREHEEKSDRLAKEAAVVLASSKLMREESARLRAAAKLLTPTAK